MNNRKQTFESRLKLCGCLIAKLELCSKVPNSLRNRKELLCGDRREYLCKCLSDRFDNTYNTFESVSKRID